MSADHQRVRQQLKVAVRLHQQGRLNEADKVYQEVLNTVPGHPDALHLSGLVARSSGHLEIALDRITRALSAQPDNQIFRNNLGSTLQALGRLDEAIACYRNVLVTNPGLWQTHFNLACALHTESLHGEAITAYETSLILNPNNSKAHNNLGLALQTMERWDEAEQHYRETIRIEPKHADAHCNLGNVKRHRGMNVDAISHYLRALEINPILVDACVHLGISYQNIDEHEKAVEIYRRAITIAPDRPDIHNNLGTALQHAHKWSEAAQSYLKAVTLMPEYADAYCNLGNVLKRLDQRENALFCYEQVLKGDPTHAIAQYEIAQLTGATASRAPNQYIEKAFDGYADNFDSHLQESLHYVVPQRLVELIRTQNHPDQKYDILDLGCGTGLMGVAISPWAKSLVGVDLSNNMLKKAAQRNLYQKLVLSEVCEMMKGTTSSQYDLIIAADVFVYIGKLDEIMEQAKRLLRPGGTFAFSVKSMEHHHALTTPFGTDGAGDYQLGDSGRYLHSINYLYRLAEINGYLIKAMPVKELRVEKNQAVHGYLGIWTVQK